MKMASQQPVWILCLLLLLGCERAKPTTPAPQPSEASASIDTTTTEAGAPELFGEGVVNTDKDEYGPTLSPDGQRLFFTLRQNRNGDEHIVFSRWEQGAWSAPEVAPFSGVHADKEPYFSPDGMRLFFASKRPINGEDRDMELWVVERTADGWSTPTHLAEVNSAVYDNYPAAAANGTLYFSSHREGGQGGNDLYRARFANGQYQTPEPLTALNTPASDADPYIDPDERFMIFSSTREGSYGEGDLYITYFRDGEWTAPENLGPMINTTGYEYTPFISPDGQYLYFSRDWGEMYRIDLNALNLDL